MYKRLLTVQDISCVGQCSMTVALPILSACGLETCILPSAVLSTHTGGFSGFTFRDLCEDFPKIISHWEKENISFDAVYTGYLGNCDHVRYVRELYGKLHASDSKFIVDPAMADNGKLYFGFDAQYVDAIRSLCADADILLPNLTEACFLADIPYPEKETPEFVDFVLSRLSGQYRAAIVLTGISYCDAETGVIVCMNGKSKYYRHKKISQSFHGTGDIYSSAFVGAYMQGKDLFSASRIAADYTVRCIEATVSDPSHWYGVKFEPELHTLIEAISAQ